VPSISALVDEIVGIPKPFRGALTRLLGIDRLDQIYHSTTKDRPIPEQLLGKLAVTYRVSGLDLQQIPRTGATVIVANHPFGILEGAVLATVLQQIRPDVRFLANQVLGKIPEIQDLVIPVDVLRGTAQNNAVGLRRTIEFLHGGGCLVVFPAGEVSHFQPREGMVADSEWHTVVARLVESLSRKGVAVSAVPVYIRGSNSFLFQTLGMLHPRIRTALLARELVNKRDRLVELRIGSPITHKKLLEIPTPKERTEYLRWRTYLLAGRSEFKPRTSRPLLNRLRQRIPRAVMAAVDRDILVSEVAALGREQLLFQAGDLEVYVTPAHAIPAVLEEIGRLRELTFRAVGEGTGKSTDVDSFDARYLHLFVWNAAKQEIVGAYRLAGTDVTDDLYTATLFKYTSDFLDKLGPALELGRSFVRPEYQRGFAPLLALWKGIGVYVARNPRYKALFGPVSISNRYQAVSRELMVTFLERNASLLDWASLISSRNPFKFGRNPFKRYSRTRLPSAEGFDLEDLSDCVADLEPTRTGVPVLLRQYLKLGGKLLGFNLDLEFSDALDGLIVVDLTKTEPRLLERYLGKAEAREFLKHQKGTYEP
jgi:putative hemolysin